MPSRRSRSIALLLDCDPIRAGPSSVRPTSDLTLTDIIRAAAYALHQAKANGKDRSVLLATA